MSANRLPLMLDGLLAAGAWALLLVLMNSVPPTLGTEIVFLVLFAAAVALTVVLLAHALGDRWAASLGRRGNLRRATRQGLIVGVLAGVLMALRFLRVLTLWVALVLVIAGLAIEALFRVRDAQPLPPRGTQKSRG